MVWIPPCVPLNPLIICVHSILGCSCNGRKDMRGLGGKCSDGPEGQWCYVYQDSGCADLEDYAGKHVSFLPCMTLNITNCLRCWRNRFPSRKEFKTWWVFTVSGYNYVTARAALGCCRQNVVTPQIAVFVLEYKRHAPKYNLHEPKYNRHSPE